MIYYQDDSLLIRSMQPTDAPYFYAEENAQGWHSTPDKLLRRIEHEAQGRCTTFVAEYGGQGAGYVIVYWNPTTGAYTGQGIPEIVDFAVLETYRRRGIGGKLMDAAEACAAKRCSCVYLGVGLHSGYGSAQRMYVKRGYIPDGSGVWYQDRVHEPYAPCVNDDDLVLYLLKRFSHDAARAENRPKA